MPQVVKYKMINKNTDHTCCNLVLIQIASLSLDIIELYSIIEMFGIIEIYWFIEIF